MKRRHGQLHTASRAVALLLLLSAWIEVAFAMDWYANPSIRATSEYDSNVLFSSDNVIDDFILIAYPQLKIFAESEQTKFIFDSVVAGKKYIKNQDLDVVENYTTASLAHAWSERFTSQFNARFTKDTTLESQVEEAGITTQRVERYLYELGSTQTYQFSETLSCAVSASGGRITYQSDAFPDSSYWQAAVRPAVALSEKDSVGVDTVYSYRSYADSAIIRYLQQLLFWERQFSETTTFTLGGGYLLTWTESPFFAFEIIDGQLELVEKTRNTSDFGFSFLANLEKEWSERVKMFLSAGRDQYNTADARTFERNYLRTKLGYDFSEVTSLYCDLNWYYNRQIGGEGVSEDVNYVQFAPTLRRNLSRDLWLSVGGSYAYQLRDQGGREATADRFRAWLMLTYELPRLLD